MLRITTHLTADTVTLHLEGRLLADWCPELCDALDAAAERYRLPVRLDLMSLMFADAAGLREIRRALARGVTLGRCSTFIAALLETQTEPS